MKTEAGVTTRTTTGSHTYTYDDGGTLLTSLDYGLGTASWDYLANGLLAKQTTDQETGLIALVYRFYAPGVGRFLNRDPVGSEGGVNLYGYVGAEPVGASDSSGQYVWVDPDWRWGDLQIAWCLARVYRQVFRDDWELPGSDRPGQADNDKQRHCYACRRIRECFKLTPVKGAVAPIVAQEVIELLQGPSSDPVRDSKACLRGIGYSLAGESCRECSTFCDWEMQPVFGVN